MKCKICGGPRAKYVVSRKKYWKGGAAYADRERGLEPRKDFRVKCLDCGAEYVNKPEDWGIEFEERKEA